MEENYNIITFESTHHSISADNCLSDIGIAHKLIPIPQEISAGCGFCLKINVNDFEKAKSALTEKSIGFSQQYSVEKKGLKSFITPIVPPSSKI